MIDKLVIGSAGAYTHDEVFELEASFAYSIMLNRYERQCYRERAEQARLELNKK